MSQLRSMSTTRITKFMRLLDEKVKGCGTVATGAVILGWHACATYWHGACPGAAAFVKRLPVLKCIDQLVACLALHAPARST